MSGGAVAESRGVIEAITPAEMVSELGMNEREAIEAGDWDALDEILEQQKALWRELSERADLDGHAEEVAAALAALYEVRRRNHALIERSFAEMRRQLTTAHTGSDARGAYQRRAGHAAQARSQVRRPA